MLLPLNRIRVPGAWFAFSMMIVFAETNPPKAVAQSNKLLAIAWSDEDDEKSEQKKSVAEKPPADRDSRLQEIERRLKQLIEDVKSLQGTKPAAAPSTPSDNTKSASKPATSTEPAKAPTNGKVDPAYLKAVTWRAIGPANMGGRITDLAVFEKDPAIFWVATASGGLLKTTNNGTTFEHQFDREETVSIGAVAVAPSDANIVWVGTGEANPRNSVSYGDGVYKSTDGGKTWKNMGLKKSYQIGRVLIHHTNPDIVYVGALGRLYGPNEERGLFKTTDGGQTWQKLLYVDDKTGVIDAVMHPTQPDTLVVAMWGRQRDGFDSWPGEAVPKPEGYDGYDPIQKWGPGGGLFKTTDGGKTFNKLTKGLPTGATGRIGLDWYRKDPNTVFAIIDCENIGKGPPPLPVYLGAVGQTYDGRARLTQIMPDSPAAKAGLQVGDVVTKAGDAEIKQFDELLDALRKMKIGDKVTLSILRGEDKKEFVIAMSARPGSGATSNAWLGVTGEDRDGKIVLLNVIPNGPAEKAGLQADDLVTMFEDKPVTTYSRMIEAIRERSIGDKLKLKVQRGTELKDVVLELEARPAGQGGFGGPGGTTRSPSDAYLGVFGEDTEGGAKLTEVSEGGPAEKAGLEIGDIVQSINGKPIANYQSLLEQLRTGKPGDKVTFAILRGKEKKEITATLDTRPGGPSRTRPYAFSYGGQSPNVQDQQGDKGFEYGGIYKSTDAGESWQRINSLSSRPMYFSVVRVDPSDDRHVYSLGVTQHDSHDGGVTFGGELGRGVHADGHAMWVDPRDGRHMIIGVDGGVYVSYDRGVNWDHLNHAAIGQFYHVAISPKHPYHVTGGLQDNGTWFGPGFTRGSNGPINEDWISVGGGDGFMCRVDPNDPDLVYFTSQNGAMLRRNLRTGERGSIRPIRARGEPAVRFNWNTPFMLSQSNSRIFYAAGNYVFRSLDRGNDLQKISPEITLTKRGSATALAESPRNPHVLYVGTDDGALWVTRDGGREWTDLTKKLGLASPRWVATIESSRAVEGRVYVCLDGHRSDDDAPLIFASEDFGQTWKSLAANLPTGSTRCLREDLQNPNLLFLGTEFHVWCSFDRGAGWHKLNGNLPTVAVHELALHPTNGEMIAATHGRSLWTCDVTPLRQLSPDVLSTKVTLYKPAPAIRWQPEPVRGRTNRRFSGTNPASGAALYYSLPKKAQRVTIKVIDIEGATVCELAAPSEPGLHRVAWDLLRMPPAGNRGGPGGPGGRTGGRGGPRGGAPQPDAPRGGQPPEAAPPMELGEGSETSPVSPVPPATPARGGPFGSGGPRIVAPGAYRVVLTVDGQDFTQLVQVERDPTLPADQIVVEEPYQPADRDDEDGAQKEERKRMQWSTRIDD